MKFILETKLPDYQKKITYQDSLLFLGSCFSDEMFLKFKNAGFEVDSNPFGTIFHPIPLAQFIQNCVDQKQDFKIEHSNDSFFSFETSNLFSYATNEELIQFLNTTQQEFFHKLKTASYLFVTLGTAWGYRHIESQEIVANCHKFPASNFQKDLSSVSELVETWKKTIQELQKVNPTLSIVFTVSPVRHSKDGLAENNRSKARLFELISQLEDQFQIGYFPSYEIVVDELRDYRFFKKDLVHPNEQAIQYIWQKIKQTFFLESALKLVEEVENIRKLQQHQVQTKNENEKLVFEKERTEKIRVFREKYPEVRI